jgi:hypothetical protein
MAQYLFVTPSVSETPAGRGMLFSRYSIPRGVTVMMVDGNYSSYRYPSQTETLAATELYMGGKEYVIEEDAKIRLTDAANGGVYGDYITEL